MAEEPVVRVKECALQRAIGTIISMVMKGILCILVV